MFVSPFNLNLLDGSNGFVINGISENDFSGDSVSSAGDVNGDGIDDIIIGAPLVRSVGATYIIFGSSNGFNSSLELF